MTRSEIPNDVLTAALREALLRLAAHEDSLAAAEAAETPYWAPCPESVTAHRAAARALREDAQRLIGSVAA